jgi:hypothetical protein
MEHEPDKRKNRVYAEEKEGRPQMWYRQRVWKDTAVGGTSSSGTILMGESHYAGDIYVAPEGTSVLYVSNRVKFYNPSKLLVEKSCDWWSRMEAAEEGIENHIVTYSEIVLPAAEEGIENIVTYSEIFLPVEAGCRAKHWVSCIAKVVYFSEEDWQLVADHRELPKEVKRAIHSHYPAETKGTPCYYDNASDLDIDAPVAATGLIGHEQYCTRPSDFSEPVSCEMDNLMDDASQLTSETIL